MTEMHHLAPFLSGATAMGFATAALFLLRFWVRTHERLFAAFAGGFALMAFNQTLIALSEIPIEDRTLLYVPRLLAFLLILAGIVEKNRRG